MKSYLNILFLSSILWASTLVKASTWPDKLMAADDYIHQLPYLAQFKDTLGKFEINQAIQFTSLLKDKATKSHKNELALLIEITLLQSKMDYFKSQKQIETRITEILKKSKELNSSICEIEAERLFAQYYSDINNHVAALQKQIRAYELYMPIEVQKIPLKSEWLYEFGARYYRFKDFQQAKAIFLNVFKTIPDSFIQGKTTKLNTIGLCYYSLKQFDSATYYFNKALINAQMNREEQWIGILSGNLAMIKLAFDSTEVALELLTKNIEISRKFNDRKDLAVSLSALAFLYGKMNKLQQSKQCADEAMSIVKEKKWFSNHNIISRVYFNTARVYNILGNHQLAFQLLDSATMAKDSVENIRESIILSGLSHKLDAEKLQNKIQIQELEVKRQKEILNLLTVLIAIGVVFIISVFYLNKRIRKEKEIATIEKQKSDNLLLNILPYEIAEELKQNGKTEAKKHDQVTVMFTDFVGFTELSNQLSPEQLLQEINYYFTAFDEIIQKYNIEKIKTIGDAFMCVSGLPKSNPNHAIEIIEAAIEMRSFISNYVKEKKQNNLNSFDIRIGVNSGPVIAGIVGVKKFAYDIWGDTVNTASRLESASEPGCINISQSTYELIKPYFNCTLRGEIDVKGKGQLLMYFVNHKLLLNS